MENKSKSGLSFGPVMASVFVPGMGQISLGKKTIGISFLIITLSVMGYGVFLFINGYLSYLDTIIGFEPNSNPPDLMKVMRLKELVASVLIALTVHAISIFHTIYLVSKAEKNNLQPDPPDEYEIGDWE